MANKFLAFFLDTPERYWIVIGGIHFHKSFWGLVMIVLGILLLFYHFRGSRSKRLEFWLALCLIGTGLLLNILSLAGNIYNGTLPIIELWEPY